MSSHGQLRNMVIANVWPNGWMRGSTGRMVVRGTRGMRGGTLGFGSIAGQPGVTILRPGSPETNNHRGMASSENRVLTQDNVFTNLRVMEYAVRGPLLLRAIEIEKELKKVNDLIHN